MPGHVGDQATANQRHQRKRDPAPVAPREADDKRECRDDHRGNTDIGGPWHQGQQRETEMPPSEAPPDRAERQEHDSNPR